MISIKSADKFNGKGKLQFLLRTIMADKVATE